MAKVVSEYDNPTTNTEDNNDAEVLTINLQPYLTPISILFSAFLISVSILVSFRNLDITSGSGTVTPTTAPNNSLTQPSTSSIDDDPYLGDRDDAKIAIIEYSDYECPFCQSFHNESYDQIISEYIDSGKAIYVFRDFPLKNLHDPIATEAALAAECVDDLGNDGKFFDFTVQYFKETASNGQGLQGKTMADLAEEVGVDKTKFSSCLESKQFNDEVEKDLNDGVSAGVGGTPSFVIGVLNEDGSVEGVLLQGAQPFSVFQTVIEEQLDKA